MAVGQGPAPEAVRQGRGAGGGQHPGRRGADPAGGFPQTAGDPAQLAYWCWRRAIRSGPTPWPPPSAPRVSASGDCSAGDMPLKAGEVLLVDVLGQLMKFFAAGDVAFVGGTLVPVGGHNLLEPAAVGLAGAGGAASGEREGRGGDVAGSRRTDAGAGRGRPWPRLRLAAGRCRPRAAASANWREIRSCRTAARWSGRRALVKRTCWLANKNPGSRRGLRLGFLNWLTCVAAWCSQPVPSWGWWPAAGAAIER